MKGFVFPRDRALTVLSMSLGVIIWLAALAGLYEWRGLRLIGGVTGAGLFAAAATFVAYLFARSAAIAHLRGNAVEVSGQQLPQLYAQLESRCDGSERRRRAVLHRS
jgi:hypothetical protein